MIVNRNDLNKVGSRIQTFGSSHEQLDSLLQRHINLWLRYEYDSFNYTHPGGGPFLVGSNGDLSRLCPETLHPRFGSNFIRTFFVSPLELFHGVWGANLPLVSSGRP
jgi:hypothetical protein